MFPNVITYVAGAFLMVIAHDILKIACRVILWCLPYAYIKFAFFPGGVLAVFSSKMVKMQHLCFLGAFKGALVVFLVRPYPPSILPNLRYGAYPHIHYSIFFYLFYVFSRFQCYENGFYVCTLYKVIKNHNPKNLHDLDDKS